MDNLEKVYELLAKELDMIASRGELSTSSLDNVYKLTCSMKCLKKIMGHDDYSMRGRDYSYDGYSRNYDHRGYSNATTKEHLEHALKDARDDRTRDEIRRIIDRM